jgi:Flp pilus assembly protein TadD
MPLFESRLSRLLLLLALPLAAQSVSGPSMVDPALVHQASARTVPIGLLHPLSIRAGEMLRKALYFSDQGDHLGAVKQLLKTMIKCPDAGAYGYGLLGVEYLKTRQFSEAVGALNEAVTLSPRDASNHANLALALMSTGEADRAGPELKRALDLDPHSQMARQLLASLVVSQNALK